MGVDLSRSRTAMPQVPLDDAEIHPGFQQMRRIRMAKRMNVGAFGDTCGADGALERLLQAAVGQGTDRRAGLQTAVGSGKQPRPRSVRFPEFTQ